jgi:hypothetical protein
MIARLCLVLATLDAASESAAPDVVARASVTPATVEVGEPFELVLELEHPGGAALPATDELLDLDDAWVVLGGSRAPGEPLAAGRSRTRFTFQVAALEPGARSLPGLPFGVAPPALDVRGVLAEGEDAPRPLRDLRPPPPAPAAATSPVPWLAGVAALLAFGGLAWWRARRRSVPAPAPGPLERFAALERAADAAARERCLELARLVREATDAHAGRPRAGLSDEEWLAALGEHGVPAPDVRAQLGDVLERCARVKFGGERPTEWALNELVGSARTALDRVTAEEVPA